MTAPAASRRTPLSFSVDHLSPRDELLLKSFIRVLDHRTHQHWNCVDACADLRVTGEADDTASASGASPVLRVGPVCAGLHALALPLHADQVEAALNHIVDAIVQARGHGTAMASTGPLRDDEEFRLRRWPPAALLHSGPRVTLATLMSARAYTLPMLQRQSGVPMRVCSDFLLDLRHAGLLHGTPAPASASPALVAAYPSILGAPTTVAPLSPPPSRAPAQPGLLARIRARFGLQPAWLR